MFVTLEAEDEILEAIRGTDLTDQSKILIKITNAVNAQHAGTGVETETGQRGETETKDHTNTDRMSYAMEFASAVIAGDTSDATVRKAISEEVDWTGAGKDTGETRETDTTTDTTKTRAADLLQGSTKEGSHRVILADAETTRVRQGEIRVLLWHKEDIKGTLADHRASTEQ